MPPALPWRWPWEEVADEGWCGSAERNRKLSNWTEERIITTLRGSGVGSSWVQMLLPAGNETSRGGAAVPESGVLLSRGTELIRAQLNPSHPAELCHGFGQIPLSSNCSCSRAAERFQLLRRAGAAPARGCVPRQGPRCRLALRGPSCDPKTPRLSPVSHGLATGEMLSGLSRLPALDWHEEPPELSGSLRVLN